MKNIPKMKTAQRILIKKAKMTWTKANKNNYLRNN